MEPVTTTKTPKRRKPRARFNAREIARLKAAFVRALAHGGPGRIGLSVAGACDKVKLATRTAYTWRDLDPAFRDAWDAAAADGTNRMEDAVAAAGVKGEERRVYDAQGRLERTERRQNPSALLAIINRRAPVAQAVELTGRAGGPLEVQRVLSPQESIALALRLRATLHSIPLPQAEPPKLLEAPRD